MIRQGSLILLAIGLPHLGLNQHQIGGWEQLLFLGFLLGTAWLNAFTQGLLVGYPLAGKSRSTDPAALLTTVLLVQLAVAIGIGGLAWWGRAWLVPLFTGQPALPYLGYFLFYLVFEWTGQYLEGSYLVRERGDRLLAYAAFSYGGLLLCFVLPLALDAPLLRCFQALAVLALAKGVWILGHAATHFRHRFDRTQLRAWWSVVVPLLAYGAISIVSGGLDPWLVGYYYAGDETQFAIYRYGARELPLIAALTIGLSQSIIPKITADSGTGLAELKRETGRLAHVIFPVSILLCATAGWWFPRVFTPAFAPATPLFQVLLLTTIPRLFFNNTVLIARGDGRILNGLVSCELLLNLVLSLLFLPYFGLWGLCLATVIALATEKALGCWWLWSRHGIPPMEYCPVPLWAGYSALLLLIWTLTII